MDIVKWRLSKKKIAFCFFAFLVIYLLAIQYGPEGDMVANSNLTKNDFYSRAALVVRGLIKTTGFQGGDKIGLVIPLPKGVTKEKLRDLLEISGKVKREFPKYGVTSLAIVPQYSKSKKLGIPHVNEEELNSPDFDIENWKKEIEKDPGSFGLFVGRNFDYFQIIIDLDSDYDEIELGNKMANFLEKQKIPDWKWRTIKNDIKPVNEFEGVILRGWGIFRRILTAILKTSILLCSVTALVFLYPVAYSLNGSHKQTILCYVAILSGFIIVRGSIGILYLCGFELFGSPIKERVYILLVDSCMIINGISFSTRKFEAYNDHRRLFPKLTSSESWSATKKFNSNLDIVSAISIFGFLTLLGNGVRGLAEFGILASLGIFYLLLITRIIIPTLHMLWGGEVIEKDPGYLVQKGNRFSVWVIKGCYWLLTRFSSRKTMWIIIVFNVLYIGGALFIVVHDYWAYVNPELKEEPYINLGTNPTSYMKGTSGEVSSQFLNQSGRCGFGNLTFFIKGDIYDPEFLRRCYQAKKQILKIEGVREAFSVISSVVYISRVEWGVDLPRTREEAEDIFFLIETDQSYLVQKNNFCDEGIALNVFIPAANSNNIERQAEEVIGIVSPNLYQKVFVERLQLSDFNLDPLVCLPYGRLHEYHQSDKKIQRNQPINVVSSYFLIAFMAGGWVYCMGKGGDTEKQHYRLAGGRTGAVMGVPYAFACSSIVYFMAISGIPLDQSMGCIGPLSISASIDFNLHFIGVFIEALKRGATFEGALYEALVEKGKVNVADIVNNAFVFSFLMFSSFYPIKLTGMMMVFMMFTCGFGALVMMAGLLYGCVDEINLHQN